jgi:cell division protein FtsN
MTKGETLVATEPKKPQNPAGSGNPANRRPRPPAAKGGAKPDPRLGGRPVTSPDDQEAELKKKLARRMAFAAVLIAVLLGALALFDQLTGPTPTVTTTKALEPAPVKEITQPVKQAEPAADAVKEEAKAAPAPEESAMPTEKGAPPPPAPEAEPSAPAKATTPPANGKAAATRPAHSLPITRPLAPVQPQPKSVPSTGHAQAGATSAPAVVAPSPGASQSSANNATPVRTTSQPAAAQAPSRPASSPAVPAAATKEPAEPAVVRTPPAPPRLFSGYALQAGVFSSTHRAEELYAKLQLNGIPATIETRVTVGPFKTREEADAAREKMKELGIDSVMLVPKGARK